MIKAYIFDWDGTLANTLELTYKIYKELFQKMKNKKLSFTDFKRLFGRDHKPLYNFMKLSNKERKKINELWLSVYKEKQKQVKLFPNVKKYLSYLKKKGFKIALVSSGKKWRVNQELEVLGIKQLFNAIITVEEIPKPKPAPDGLIAAAKKIRIKPEDCVYIGDMAEDVIAGKKAGMKTGIVTYGMHKRQELLKLKPDFVYTKLKEKQKKKSQ